MGMAASQARFLGLTARRTNIEYEGQQINQQRTALGNQTANYYNQMLGMQVPVPPSVQDFTKTVYTFDDGAITNSITSMIAQPNGEYKVAYSRQWVDPDAIVSAPPSIITRSGTDPDYAYYVGGAKLRLIDQTDSDANNTIDVLEVDVTNPTAVSGYLGTTGFGFNSDGVYEKSDASGYYDPRFANKTEAEVVQILKQEALWVQQLNEQYGNQNWMVRYVKNTTTNDWEPSFYAKDVLTSVNTSFGANGNSQSTIPAYKTGPQLKNDEIKNREARFEMDATGRPINVTLIDPSNPNNNVTHALTTNTVTDQRAYDDAMNQYEFDKNRYEKEIHEVNAKIEIIQVQDRNLELRLKQLDTEHNAVQTEMDAVSKVIQKNVESTFKTFG